MDIVVEKQRKLNFSSGNAKLYLHKSLVSFSLLAGHTCPFAKDCLSFVDLKSKKPTLKDGKHTKFRCFSASQEVLYPTLMRSRKHNMDLIKSCKTQDEIVELLISNLPKKAEIVRLHVSGDFFSQMYFDAWLEVAVSKPDILFYAYTKALPFWVNRLNQIPENFVLTASYGGKQDKLIQEYNLKAAVVVFSPEEAAYLGYEIDHDDKLAMIPKVSFALLLHGVQPKNSPASKALSAMRNQGVKFNYTRQ